MNTRFHGAVEYALLSLSITKGNLRWAWYEAWYVVGELTAGYPENLQNYLAHAQAVDTRHPFRMQEGLGTRLR